MLTRSRAQKLAAEAAAQPMPVAQPLPNAQPLLAVQPAVLMPVALQHSGTIIQIGPSATGEGRRTKWIYPLEPTSKPPGVDDVTVPTGSDVVKDPDAQRFITPAPTIMQVQSAPRKSNVAHYNRNNTPISPLGKAEPTLSSKRTPRPHRQQFQPRLPANIQHRSPAVIPGARLALGPCGTELISSDGRTLYERQGRQLGPFGTELIGKQYCDMQGVRIGLEELDTLND